MILRRRFQGGLGYILPVTTAKVSGTVSVIPQGPVPDANVWMTEATGDDLKGLIENSVGTLGEVTRRLPFGRTAIFSTKVLFGKV